MLVQDVFADFVGSGKREWHSVLVGSAGGDSRELFALDITDPLNPVLLWDLVGSTRRTGGGTPRMGAVADFANGTDPSSLTTHATVLKWDGDSTSTDYKLPPATASGRSATKMYDFSGLGGTNSLSMGLLRVGLNPVYAVFVAASSSALATTPSKGLDVFALDVATGQKLWEWERAYDSTDTTKPHDNYAPRGVTLYYGTEGATTVLVGDFDGKLWQLDAATGVNRNYQATGCTGDCNLPAFDTHSVTAHPQPITSNIALAKLPATGVTGDFANFGGQTMVLFGTAGASSVPSSEQGAVHALILGTQYRKPLGATCSPTPCVSKVNPGSVSWSSASSVVTDAKANGVLEEPASTWPKVLPSGQRVFGFLTVAGTTAFVPAVTGQVAIEDLMHIDPTTAGATYTIDLASVTGTVASGNSLTAFNKANFGGVAVYTWPPNGSGQIKQSVVGAEINNLVRYDTSLHTSGANAMDANKTLKTNSGETGVGYRLLNWFRKFAK
jgi:type IV pilus assembly protein PilY1